MEENEKGYILVIDDDPLLSATLKKALEMEGFSVEVANDGYEGIKKAKSGFFHLVLCDMKMPGLDGIMTIRQIQKFQKQANVGQSGFIVITAYDTQDTREQAFQLGVSDFLMKPFDLSKFMNVVSHNAESLLKDTPATEVKRLNARLERLLNVVKKEEG